MSEELASLSSIDRRLTEVSANMVIVMSKLEEMKGFMERLTRVEERIVTMASNNEAFWKKYDALVDRIAELEKAEPMQAQTTKWIMGAVWAIVGAAAAFVARQVGAI
jgi:hypothetical protein